MTRMKESSIDWIGQIPEEWEIVKFKYLFNTSKGLSITKEYLVDEGIPVINYGQIHSSLTKQVQSCDDRLPFVANYYLSKKGVKLNQGDFVFADTSEDLEGAGNFSTRLDSTGQLLAGYHAIIARLNDYDEHDFRYFMHLFDSLAIRKQIQNKVSGVKVYSVTQGILNSIFVIIPPKNEQQKIADFLDKKTAQLDKVKALLEEQIQKLKDYRASLIYETVTKGLDKTVPMKDSGIDWIGQVPEGWGVKPLKYLASYDDETLTQSEINSNRKIDYVDISSVEFTKGINGHQEFSTLEAPSRARKIAKKGDTIISTVRTYLKAIAYVNNDYIVSTGFCVVRPKKINSKYLNYTIMSDSFTGPVSKYAWGVSYPAISSSQLVNIPIPFPESIEEQLSIVDYLDHKMLQINQLIDIKQEQIENINKQRQTLIFDYVTGKRRV